ncbi:MmcQ/YjbR family DNA-binding protein [Pseudochryseolinea flava]|uniref:MmcQ/YjbR family DNA-binding protein n=1 Tax=Pseudochryseolinea flava TaxID=2059302 RepID=A0A364XZX0_9BACT|nr:MmcQ/YjbR family DNA-binding protein [Pseudochryseolinea flava]RAW00074.1 MmcQ/YjbR family DNA-binding protein [Pseudochryseolinea flava]
MISVNNFRKIALGLAEVEEQPHWENPSFRVRKKIFATLKENEKRAVVKLTALNQSVFCAYDEHVIYPVPGGWGKQGWTIIDLRRVKASICKDALITAYCTVAPKKLSEPYQRI